VQVKSRRPPLGGYYSLREESDRNGNVPQAPRSTTPNAPNSTGDWRDRQAWQRGSRQGELKERRCRWGTTRYARKRIGTVTFLEHHRAHLQMLQTPLALARSPRLGNEASREDRMRAEDAVDLVIPVDEASLSGARTYGCLRGGSSLVGKCVYIRCS